MINQKVFKRGKMPRNDKSLDNMVEDAPKSDGQILYQGLKIALNTMIPIKGQIFYAKHTRLPKPLGVALVTAWQFSMYTPLVMYAIEKLTT